MITLGNKLAAVALLAFGSMASAQDYYEPHYAYECNPMTGDAGFDATLLELNTLYAGDLGWYVDDIVYSTGASRNTIESLILERHYPPADVYMIAQTARVSGKSFDYVQREFDANRGQGWGVVAKRLGIKPGSAEFHRLKSGAGTWSTQAKVKVKQKKSKGPPVREATEPGVAARPGKGNKGKGAGAASTNDKGKGKGKGKGNEKGKGK